jgi:hypothetical protein
MKMEIGLFGMRNLLIVTPSQKSNNDKVLLTTGHGIGGRAFFYCFRTCLLQNGGKALPLRRQNGNNRIHIDARCASNAGGGANAVGARHARDANANVRKHIVLILCPRTSGRSSVKNHIIFKQF